MRSQKEDDSSQQLSKCCWLQIDRKAGPGHRTQPTRTAEGPAQPLNAITRVDGGGLQNGEMLGAASHSDCEVVSPVPFF